MMAQNMSDSQVLEYVKEGIRQGKEQKQLASELARKGVTKEQAMRVKQLYEGSVVILGGLSLVNSLHAYTFASLKRKKLISTTPLNDALNALILALNASAAAFVLLFTKKFRILS